MYRRKGEGKDKQSGLGNDVDHECEVGKETQVYICMRRLMLPSSTHSLTQTGTKLRKGTRRGKLDPAAAPELECGPQGQGESKLQGVGSPHKVANQPTLRRPRFRVGRA